MNDLIKPMVPNRVQEINNTIASQGNKDFSVAPGILPTTISSSSLAPTQPINLPTLTPPSTIGSAITAGVDSKITQGYNDIQKQEQDYANKAKETASVSKGFAEKYLGFGADTLKEKVDATQTPEFLAKKQASDTAYKDLQSSKQSQMAEIEAVRGQNLTDAGRASAISGINDKYAYKNAYLGMTYDIANKDYASAQDQINTAAQLKMDSYKPYIEYYTQLASNDQNIFNKAELEKINTLKSKYENDQKVAGEFEKTKGELMKQAGINGADYATIQAMGRATDMTSLVQSAGQYAGDVLERQIKQNNLYKSQLEIQKAKRDLEPGTGGDAPLYNGLSSPTATAVRGIVSGFKSEPQLTNFATIQDGYNFVQSIPDKTTNPADDQALVYALAKTLDPGSVVREGEYATAQKYSQSWIKAYGKGVEQAVAGTGFLSETARKNIKNTIETKYKSSKVSYDNLYNQYGKQINNLTGRDDGTKFLRDYAVETKTPSNVAPEDDLLLKQFGL